MVEWRRDVKTITLQRRYDVGKYYWENTTGKYTKVYQNMNKLDLQEETKQVLRHESIKHLMLYLYWQRNIAKNCLWQFQSTCFIPLLIMYKNKFLKIEDSLNKGA